MISNRCEPELPFTGLSIGYRWSDEQSFEIRLIASNGDFSGSANIYENRHVFKRLATVLQGFPKSATDSCRIQLGGGPNYAGGSATLLLSGGTGPCVLHLSLCSGHRHEATDQRVTMRMLIEPSAIDAFVAHLEQLQQLDQVTPQPESPARLHCRPSISK